MSNYTCTLANCIGDGSERGADRGGDADYVHSLQSLVDHYLEPARLPLPSADSSSPPFTSLSPTHHELQATFQTVGKKYGELRKEIMRAIRKGSTQMYAYTDGSSPSYELLHGLVLEHLRKLGFNAGICKSQRALQKNSPIDSFPTEEYEYMDVIIPAEKGSQAHASERILIDLRFRSQFEIARPSSAYVNLLEVVPAAYVGTPCLLQDILSVLSEAMKKSLESQHLPLPPWRKLTFLHSKWLSPHHSRSIFPPPLGDLHHIISNPSTKRETFLCSTHKAPSYKRECSYSMENNNPTCDVTKHKSTKKENFHSLVKNPTLSFARPPLLVNTKHTFNSGNLTCHTPMNDSNKQAHIQSGVPMKVPWKSPPLYNSPISYKGSKRLVGALTLALHSA